MDISPPPGIARPIGESQADEWLRHARDGSRSALGRLLEASRDYLLLVARRALDEKLKAKIGPSDLVQDTFVEAQRGFEQFRGQSQNEFHAWLVGILAHRLANSVRHYRHTLGRTVDRELPPEIVEAALARLRDESATPGAISEVREDQFRVQLALAQLPEPLRSVLVERTWQGATFAEIGSRRGISESAARKTWARAVHDLQGLLAELDIG